MNLPFTHDNQIRIQAFEWLHKARTFHGDVLPRKELEKGFIFQNQRVPFLGPQGIWKPAVCDTYPLSITTSPKSPYNDAFSGDNLLLYKYRGTDPNHRDNVGLRMAIRDKIPLIYFHGIEVSRYLAVWPVFIIGDDPANLTFTVAAEDSSLIPQLLSSSGQIIPFSESTKDDARRSYITSQVKVRLHQSSFREKVLKAYLEQCTLCHLKHRELLDAAHIIPDHDPEGLPVVSNGLSLCKIHHAAFDKNIIGISPDYQVEVREDILREVDGPMLQYGLQKFHGEKIIVPRRAEWKPNPEFLDKRFQEFRAVG